LKESSDGDTLMAAVVSQSTESGQYLSVMLSFAIRNSFAQVVVIFFYVIRL